MLYIRVPTEKGLIPNFGDKNLFTASFHLAFFVDSILFKKLKKQLDRNSSALINYCNFNLLYKTIGVDFLDHIAQKHDANRYMKNHFFQSDLLDLADRNILEISFCRERATTLENSLL